MSVLIGNAWTSAMQSRLGVTSDDPAPLGLQADCFAGAWVGSVPIDQDGTVQACVSSRPGSLLRALARRSREVVQSFLVFGDPVEANEAVRGTSFERMEAFRLGFFQDEATCEQLTS
jgi:predicted metalloprotease